MGGLSDNDGGLNFGDGLIWQDAIGGGSFIIETSAVSAFALEWGAGAPLEWGAANEMTWGT